MERVEKEVVEKPVEVVGEAVEAPEEAVPGTKKSQET
jgi:hypothetical protein